VTNDIDVACAKQIEYLERHELIPEDVRVHGHVYEVESGHLRRPGERVAEKVNTRVEGGLTPWRTGRRRRR
jgi:carbonic anhydrase